MLQDRKTPRDSRKRRYAGALAAAVLLHGIPSAGWVHPYQPPHVRDSAIVRQALESNPASRSMDTLTLAFIGDVMLHQAQIAGSLRDDGSHDFTGYFSSIADDLTEADIATANMEFTLAGEPYTGYPSFSAPDSYAEYMAECGIDVFLTANNHILDKGEKGLDRTIRAYRELEKKYGSEKFVDTIKNSLGLKTENNMMVKKIVEQVEYSDIIGIIEDIRDIVMSGDSYYAVKLQGNDKYYARIKVLSTVVNAIEERLKE